ncbi:MAG: glycosyltransferase family 2 protein, partial [Ferruginibacter sp.]
MSHTTESSTNTNTPHQLLVSIVILNWNGAQFLKQFLPSVINSTYLNKKIIVADNASTDDSVQMLQENFPEVEIIINPYNEGFAKGYNSALKKIKSDIYVLLNSDVEVTPGWIEPIVELMQTDKDIAACQPKILSYHNKSNFEYAGASGGWIDSLGYPFARGRVFDVCEKDEGQYDDVQECFWASGASLFIRAEDFKSTGGLDEFFFAHQEEIDLCWRLKNLGKKIYAVPQSVVYHVGGGTLPKGNSKKTFLNFRNNLIMLHKNLPLKSLWWKIPVRISLDIVAAIQSLISGDRKTFNAILKAEFNYFKWVVGSKDEIVRIKSHKNTTGVFA